MGIALHKLTVATVAKEGASVARGLVLALRRVIGRQHKQSKPWVTRRSTPIFKMLHAIFLSKDMLLQNSLGLLAARADVLAGVHPFGPAVFGALLAAGGRKEAVAMGLSIIIGTATTMNAALTAATFVAVLISLSLIQPPSPGASVSESGQGAGAESGRESEGGRQVTRSIVTIVLVFWITRLSMVWYLKLPDFELVAVTVEAFMTGLLAFLLTPLASFKWSKAIYVLDRKTWIAIALLACVAGLGLHSMTWWWIRPVEVWMRWITMVAALIGASGAGAAVGTLFGGLLALAGARPIGGAIVVAMSGLFSGLAAKKGKVGVALGFLLGQLLLSGLAIDGQEISLGLSHTGLAILLLMLTPNAWISKLARLVPGSEAYATTRLAREERLREAVNERLHQLSVLFNELAAVFSGPVAPAAELSADNEELQGLIQAVWSHQCQRCTGFHKCWRDNAYQSYWDFVDLIAVFDRQGGELSESDLPGGMASRCVEQKAFVQAVNTAISSRGRRHNPVKDSRQFVPQQLRGVAQLIENAAGQVKLHTGRAEEMEAFLREVPNLRMADGVEITVTRAGDYPEIDVVYSGPCDGYGSCAAPVVMGVETAIGKRYKASTACRRKKGDVCHIRLVPIPPYELHVEAIHLAKGGKHVSGDCFAQLDLGEGKIALIISDGMGVGPQAAVESHATIRLLEKMIKAGFDRTFAAETVNAALLMRSQAESFATLDLAIVNTFSGETEFLKGGSSPSFIKRRNGVDVVRSDSLPVGILEDIEVQSHIRFLSPDDVLIMATDGVFDLLPHHTDKEEWMVRLLKGEETREPKELAHTVIERASHFTGGEIHDDLTVLVARLVRRSVIEGEIPVYARADARS